MRLLYYEDGQFRLTEDLRSRIPPYAILSHRWYAQNDEVNFFDITNGFGQDRIGFHKIEFCAAQAKRDGLKYFWIDTCCIDKSNSDERSRSITSMCAWYANAEHCYVYLSDVASIDDERGSNAFDRSQWFTRGWTLQELLAPLRVSFFSNTATSLGTREELSERIQKITRIDKQALLGRPLYEFSVEKRFSWAVGRDTSEPEDKAYCLLGIFGVSMAPHYGEGENAAYDRLKEQIIRAFSYDVLRIHIVQEKPRPMLRENYTHASSSAVTKNTMPRRNVDGPTNAKAAKLPVSLEVRREMISGFLWYEEYENGRLSLTPNLESTCQWIIVNTIFRRWLNPKHQDDTLLWIKGHPGVGKSTLMKYVDDLLPEMYSRFGAIVISFYFNAHGAQLEKSVEGMYRSLIVQLLQHEESLEYVLDHLKLGHREPPESKAFAKLRIWQLQEIFSALIAKLAGRKVFCLIDALDETDEEDVLDTVYFLKSFRTGSNLLFCFSSRHYPVLDLPTHLQIVVEDEPGHNDDILHYLLTKIRIDHDQNNDHMILEAIANADGIFTWIVLAVSMLNKKHRLGHSIVSIEDSLQQMPHEAVELLKEILGRENDSPAQFKGLMIILYAARPLSLKEYFVATMDELTPDNVLWSRSTTDWFLMEKHLLATTFGLAELTFSAAERQTSTAEKSDSKLDTVNLAEDGTPRVEFVHEAVRNFLLSDSGSSIFDAHSSLKLPHKAHHILRDVCAGSLRLVEQQDGQSDREILELQNPLLDYAAEFVLYHADQACRSKSEEATKSQEAFLTSFPITRWYELRFGLSSDESYIYSFLRTAVQRDYYYLAEDLLLRDRNAINKRDSDGWTLLMTAVRNGGTEMVALLLKHGAKVHARNFKGRGAFDMCERAEIRSMLTSAIKQDHDDREQMSNYKLEENGAASANDTSGKTTSQELTVENQVTLSPTPRTSMQANGQHAANSPGLHTTKEKAVKNGLWKRVAEPFPKPFLRMARSRSERRMQ